MQIEIPPTQAKPQGPSKAVSIAVHVLILLILCAASGCTMVIPGEETCLRGDPVDNTVLEGIFAAGIHRDDVIRQLGDPTWQLPDGRVAGYEGLYHLGHEFQTGEYFSYLVIGGLLAAGSGGAANALVFEPFTEDIYRDRTLMMLFDEQGKLTQISDAYEMEGYPDSIRIPNLVAFLEEQGIESVRLDMPMISNLVDDGPEWVSANERIAFFGELDRDRGMINGLIFQFDETGNYRAYEHWHTRLLVVDEKFDREFQRRMLGIARSMDPSISPVNAAWLAMGSD